ncbi:MAG TPA: alpha-L-fucosidase, partial [Parafilimonas sp.]|nr:alpha-L-fucosidase [Parafilimonas sp.]
WESCITMGNSWSYVPTDKYKSTNQLIHMLARIISRGGNLLLNIGPSPEGDWSDTAYSRLLEIGKWMQVHGEAVYNTIPLAPYQNDNVVYLQSKDRQQIYVYVLSDDNTDKVALPTTLKLDSITLNKKNKVILLDNPSIKISQKTVDGISTLIIPQMNLKNSFKYAAVFKIERSL